MAIQTWFTQPDGGYASFYMYDDANHHFVRIRLNQNHVDGGGAVICVRVRRAVAFSSSHTKNVICNGSGDIIIEDGRILPQFTPMEDMYVYDSNFGATPHRGHKVTMEPHLPPGVDGEMLESLAERYIKASSDDDIPIVPQDASDDQLREAIRRML